MRMLSLHTDIAPYGHFKTAVLWDIFSHIQFLVCLSVPSEQKRGRNRKQLVSDFGCPWEMVQSTSRKSPGSPSLFSTCWGFLLNCRIFSHCAKNKTKQNNTTTSTTKVRLISSHLSLVRKNTLSFDNSGNYGNSMGFVSKRLSPEYK